MAHRMPSVKAVKTAAATEGVATVALISAAKPKASSGSMPRRKDARTMPADHAQNATVANAPTKAEAVDEVNGHRVLRWATTRLKWQNPMQ
jgi:hypothetical protein